MTTLTDHESNSMLIDVVVAVLLNIQPANPPPPPAAHDHPYANVRIIERKDLWMKYGTWAWTKQPRFPGDLCTIYHAPLGAWLKKEGVTYVLDAVAFPQMIRHEMGHCHGLGHPPPNHYTNEWIKSPKPERRPPWS